MAAAQRTGGGKDRPLGAGVSMAVASVERRLAAILAADVVGYSRLMGEDEEGTLERLKAHRRELIDPAIAAHHGHMVKLTGDGALVEFGSVVDAVACAVEIQRAMALRNADVPASQRIQFRVGINLGDVIIEPDDIYGDGVNVAARLEALAEPGGICVSRLVQESVRGKLDVAFDDLGEQRLKNIAEPVRAYRVRTAPGAARRLIKPLRPSHSRWIAAVAAGLVLLIGVGGAAWHFYLQPLLEERAYAAQTALPLPDKPSIAVLPFVNMSTDLDQEYFSDGMTENLITNLSKLSGLFVIARNTAFTYKERSVNVPEVGRELGVRYVLEGSVQKASERVRIHAQLIDAATGFHVWAEQFDRELGDIFALQDEVTSDIIAALEVELSEAERRTLAQRYTDSLEAYDTFLRGWEELWRGTHEANLRAREYFEQAIKLDPRFARAYANLALTYVSETGLLLPKGSLEQAYDLAQTAVDLDDSLPQVHWVLADVHVFRGELEQGLATSKKVLSLDPNYADAYAQHASILSSLGRPKEALTSIEHAMRLNPRYPALYLRELGKIEFTMRRYEDAIASLEGALERHPNLWDARLFLAASYAHADRVDDAEWQLLEVLTVNPDLTLAHVDESYANDADLDHLIEGLRKAGLTE
jgi:adenylate cyclase